MNEEEALNNTQVLKDFVNDFKLMDSYSRVSFKAKVEIETSQNNLELSTGVRITFDGYKNYGTLTIIDAGIDSNLYPEIFYAQYQDFVIANDTRLIITGNHTKNPKIGNYTVKLPPYNRTKFIRGI